MHLCKFLLGQDQVSLIPGSSYNCAANSLWLAGKTKVLTARVAYLIHHFKLDPSEVVAVRIRSLIPCVLLTYRLQVTFTNKAALEMKKRLNALLGEVAASKLVLGMFIDIHLSLAVR